MFGVIDIKIYNRKKRNKRWHISVLYNQLKRASIIIDDDTSLL